jgi:hypothetical protein
MRRPQRRRIQDRVEWSSCACARRVDPGLGLYCYEIGLIGDRQPLAQRDVRDAAPGNVSRPATNG